MAANGPRIHPSAIVDLSAELSPDVVVGPYAVIEGPVRLGPGCVVRARAHLIGDIVASAGNDFGIGCVVGERAQHLQYRDAPGRVDIGDGNTFREYVTIHRGTPGAAGTRIGSRNFLMCNTHVAHDCTVGDGCVFANGAVIGGHAVIQDGVFLSGNTGVHQNCQVGRLAIVSATSSATKDIPPFAILEGRNTLIGVNVVGLKRADMSSAQIDAVRRAYRVLLTSGLLLSAAVARLERELGHVDAVAELLKFIHTSKRGICLTRARRRRGTD
jgi:UDP-N-acetylglucosamine acyltransferase